MERGPSGRPVVEWMEDPRQLARMTNQMDQRQPGILGQLVAGRGGGTSGMLENPIAKAALAGMLRWRPSG